MTTILRCISTIFIVNADCFFNRKRASTRGALVNNRRVKLHACNFIRSMSIVAQGARRRDDSGDARSFVREPEPSLRER